MITENTYISSFDVKQDGTILVRKTTDILKDGKVLATSHWRCILEPGSSIAPSVLNEQNYLNLANQIWTQEVIDNYNTKLQEASNNSPF